MKFDVDEIKKYIQDNPNARVIIGGDSQKVSRKGKKRANPRESRFVTAVVVYEKDHNKIFYEVTKEKDFDQDPGRPFNRMMNETYKVADITLKLMEVLVNRNFEIHLDISPHDYNGSNVAMGAAIGYIWGVIGIEPILKPDSWCASCVSDHIVKKNRDVLNYE